MITLKVPVASFPASSETMHVKVEVPSGNTLPEEYPLALVQDTPEFKVVAGVTASVAVTINEAGAPLESIASTTTSSATSIGGVVSK